MAIQYYDVFFAVAAAGGAPSFDTFKDNDTGTALTKPTITDIGGGFYRFGVDWASISPTLNIRYSMTLAGWPDQWSDISSPASVTTPGTLTPSITQQNTAIFPSASTVLNRAAIQCGITATAVTDPYAQTDQSWTLLCELLTSLLDDLIQAHDWTHLVLPVQFTTDGVSTAYTLPADFHEMVDQSLWNLSSHLPGIGPVSFQQVSALQARLINVVLNVIFQIQGGLLAFPIVPPAGSQVAFKYVSDYAVQSNSGTMKAKPSASSDLLFFDEELLVLGLKLKWLEEKGFDTARTQERFDAKLEHEIGRNVGGAVISLGNSGRNTYDRMIDGSNIPFGNWPSA